MSFDRDARIEAMLSIARRLRDARDPLGIAARERLFASACLSREGLELALSEHLETQASSAERARMCAWAGEAPRCHVVLSANVVTGAFRAILLGLLSAPVVFVKPSRRQPELAQMIVGELAPVLKDGAISLVDTLSPGALDVVHGYGSDTTMAAIARALPEGVRFRGHGSGFGVALIDEAADIDAAADALARDVVVFDQRGCLSPRVALVLGAPARGLAFARALHGALARFSRLVPVGERDNQNEVSAFAQIMLAIGDVFQERDHLVAFEAEPTAMSLPPAARVVSVLSCTDLSAATSLMAPFCSWITSLGVASAEPLETFDALRPRGARLASVGSMQRPPLDGPVDERGR